MGGLRRVVIFGATLAFCASASAAAAQAGGGVLPPAPAAGSPPPAPAPPQTPEEQSLALRLQANAAYLEGRFDAALEALARAQALAPYRLHDFNVAAVEHQLGHCERARELFERYLRIDPAGPAVADARLALEELYAQCGHAPPLPPAAVGSARVLPAPSVAVPAQVPEGATSVPAVASERLAAGPSPQRIAGWSLIALGGAASVGAVVSSILVQRARADLEALAGAEGRVWNVEEGRALDENGERYETLSLACGFGAALLVGTGVGLVLWEQPAERVGVLLDGRAGLVYSRTF